MRGAPLAGGEFTGWGRRFGRKLSLGCLGAGLALGGVLFAIVAGILSGPIGLALPGGSRLSMGKDDFVLSNYSFQSGTTYFVDLRVQGARGIVEFQHLADDSRLDIVFHGATRESRSEQLLVSLRLPGGSR